MTHPFLFFLVSRSSTGMWKTQSVFRWNFRLNSFVTVIDLFYRLPKRKLWVSTASCFCAFCGLQKKRFSIWLTKDFFFLSSVCRITNKNFNLIILFLKNTYIITYTSMHKYYYFLLKIIFSFGRLENLFFFKHLS